MLSIIIIVACIYQLLKQLLPTCSTNVFYHIQGTSIDCQWIRRVAAKCALKKGLVKNIRFLMTL